MPFGTAKIQSQSVKTFIERLPARPYCTDDLRAGLVIRTKKIALTKPYLQYDGPTHRFWLVFDVDHPDAGLRWSDVNAPPPNLVVINPVNGHAHYLYALETSVRTAPDGSLKALKYAAMVESGLRAKIGADAGYSGLVTKNPVDKDWICKSWTDHLYTLDELADYVDLTTVTISRKAANDDDVAGLGRNCDLFERLRKWSYRAIRQGWPDSERWHEAVLQRAQMLNDYSTPLAYNEVKATAKSVAKWTYSRFSDSEFSAIQASRGQRGGKVSKRGPVADSERTLKPWEDLGISRRTYYRRKNGTR